MEPKSRVERYRRPATPRRAQQPEARQRRTARHDLVHRGERIRMQRPALLARRAEARVEIGELHSQGVVDVRLADVRL
jgi:hypothetical protein